MVARRAGSAMTLRICAQFLGRASGGVPQRPLRERRLPPRRMRARDYTRVVRLPFEPPLEPMLAKVADDLPDGRRLAVRAEVGRLPGARLPRRRRGLHPEPRPEAARPLLPGARGAAPRGAARALRARRRDRDRRRRRRSTSTRCCCASTRPRRGSRCWRPRRRRRSSPGTCSPLGDEDLRARAPGRAPRAARGGARRRPAAASTSRPATRDRAIAADWFDRFEGAGLDGVVAKRLDGAVPARQAGDGQDQARAHGRLRRRRLPLAQERARARSSARCCSGSTTTTARSTTSASPSSFTWERRAALVEELAPLRENALDGPPLARVGRVGRQARRRVGPAHARARRAAGTAARTCPGSRSASSASARSPTTTCRATASATPRRSGAGAPTSRPADCRYDQLEVTPAVRAGRGSSGHERDGGVAGERGRASSRACVSRVGCARRRLRHPAGDRRRRMGMAHTVPEARPTWRRCRSTCEALPSPILPDVVVRRLSSGAADADRPDLPRRRRGRSRSTTRSSDQAMRYASSGRSGFQAWLRPELQIVAPDGKVIASEGQVAT